MTEKILLMHFSDSDASVGLVIGGFIALIFTFIYYMLRDVLSFREFTECIPEGFKAMIAPILILAMAWTLSGMTNLLGANVFVANLVAGSASHFRDFYRLLSLRWLPDLLLLPVRPGVHLEF